LTLFNRFRMLTCVYRGADKSLARPTSRCILFDGESILFDASLVIYTEWPQKMYTLLQQFGGFDSVWIPMVATSNTYIESKIQGHISYQFCFCINTVVTIIE